MGSKRKAGEKSSPAHKPAATWRPTSDQLYLALVFFLAAVIGVVHKAHVYQLFEQQRFFSHLSTLERELSFRTEMGLYYSYYKTIAEAPSFMDGVQSVVQCNLTEYPDTVNVFRRFNLGPELILGAAYRTFTWYAKRYDIKTMDCYSINRGQGMAPVQSCEGMGDIAYFYVMPIFWLHGLLMSLLFLLGVYLAGNILGGVLVVASYFFNHGESTRVMWTPPLRESFSFPFLMGQFLVLSYILRSRQPSLKHGLVLASVTCCFMLPWQFAQFALLTQTVAIFILYMLKFIDAKKTTVIMFGLWAAHLSNIILQFVNTLLISSFFMSAMISVLIVISLESIIERLPHRILIWLVQGSLFILCSFIMKITIAKFFNIQDDSHIFDILRAKFTDFKDFHTLLYVCAPEFNFITIEYWEKITKTLLLPTSVITALVIVMKVIKGEWDYWVRGIRPTTEDEEGRAASETKPHTVHFYFVLQTIAFMMMTVILMRMKLFGTPALCIMTSMLASRQVFGFIGSKTIHYGLVVGVIAGMAVQGYANLNEQFNMKGEYNNPDQEQMIEWIKANTAKNAVFAGSMPLMATVKLSAGRPIVNHPHYEDTNLRARNKRVYQVFSRKPCNYVHKELKAMHINYVVIDIPWCNRVTQPGDPYHGCALSENWDVEDVENRGKVPCCQRLAQNPRPFTHPFHNNGYNIFKV